MQKVIVRQADLSRFFCIVAAGLLFFSSGYLHPGVKNGYDQGKLSEIKVLLDGLYDKGQIPNYVVEIAKGGESIYSISRGSTELGGRVPVGGDTIYVVASMSNPIVSTAVLKLTAESALANTVKSALIRKLIQGV